MSGSMTKNDPTVVNCYSLVDLVWGNCGGQLTEGMYLGNPATPYEQAQANQLNWLLDQIGCGAGSRILDIGCGYGTLLAQAAGRGAKAVGITISPIQARRCCNNGLDVRLLNYRDIWASWNNSFDGIVANGSIEHFPQPRDALAGRVDDIYSEMFAICHRLLKENGRFATTVIHTNPSRYVPDPAKMTRSPFSFRWGSDDFHAALLLNCIGGFCPQPGQLQRCAFPYFDLVEEVDGTEDFRLTAEEWLRRIGQTVKHWRRGPLIALSSLPFLVRHPRQGLLSLVYMATHSWQWQFRGENPPTRLFRHVWKRRAL